MSTWNPIGDPPGWPWYPTYPTPVATAYGWQCPVCKTVWAPFMSQCLNPHEDVTVNVTITNATNEPDE